MFMGTGMEPGLGTYKTEPQEKVQQCDMIYQNAGYWPQNSPVKINQTSGSRENDVSSPDLKLN